VSSKPRISSAVPGERPSAFAHLPQVSEAFWYLYGLFWRHGTLDHRTKEIARIRNARLTNCGL
jgi:hypothetical protein